MLGGVWGYPEIIQEPEQQHKNKKHSQNIL